MKLILSAALLLSLNAFANSTGVPVGKIEAGSAYSQWTLQEGDVIKKINNKEVASMNDLMAHMGNPKDVKNLTVLRKNKEIEVKISK